MLTAASAFPPSPHKKPQEYWGFCFMEFYVYILQSKKNLSFYKGSTHDLFRRFKQHNAGKDKATSRYAPWNLVWFAPKPTKSEAYILEKKLKNLSVKRTIDFINKYPVENSKDADRSVSIPSVTTLKSLRNTGAFVLWNYSSCTSYRVKRNLEC